MARTSECGEGENSSGGSNNSREAGQSLAAPIKKEALINLDQSSDLSLSAEEKDWLFVPASSSNSNGSTSKNELVNHPSVLFGSNVTDSAGKEKMERVLDNASRFARLQISIYLFQRILMINSSLSFFQCCIKEAGFQLASGGNKKYTQAIKIVANHEQESCLLDRETV